MYACIYTSKVAVSGKERKCSGFCILLINFTPSTPSTIYEETPT